MLLLAERISLALFCSSMWWIWCLLVFFFWLCCLFCCSCRWGFIFSWIEFCCMSYYLMWWIMCCMNDCIYIAFFCVFCDVCIDVIICFAWFLFCACGCCVCLSSWLMLCVDLCFVSVYSFILLDCVLIRFDFDYFWLFFVYCFILIIFSRLWLWWLLFCGFGCVCRYLWVIYGFCFFMCCLCLDALYASVVFGRLYESYFVYVEHGIWSLRMFCVDLFVCLCYDDSRFDVVYVILLDCIILFCCVSVLFIW